MAIYLLSVFQQVTEHDKKLILEYTRSAYYLRRKRSKAEIAPADYMLEIPANPEEMLQGAYAHLYQKLKCKGCWLPCPLPMLEVDLMNSSYKCRGGGQGHCMDKLFQMQSKLLQLESLDECNITFLNGQKKRPLGLEDNASSMGMFDKKKRALEDQPLSSLRRPATLFDIDSPCCQIETQYSEDGDSQNAPKIRPSQHKSGDDAMVPAEPKPYLTDEEIDESIELRHRLFSWTYEDAEAACDAPKLPPSQQKSEDGDNDSPKLRPRQQKSKDGVSDAPKRCSVGGPRKGLRLRAFCSSL